jgi:hypothetical protein
MSKEIISTNKITNSYKIVKNGEFSTGNMNQGNVDSQSICTCGKWRTDTHSTYNGTIKTNLKSDGYCTCTYDDGKDMSLCNCYKRNTNRTANRTVSTNSQNIYIQNNNDYSISNERHIFTTASENARNAQTEEENNANNININKKVCICGRRDHEINNLNISNMMTTSNNELPIQTTDYEERERGRKEIISKVKQSRTEIREEVRVENEESAWTGDIFIQVMERLQYLAAEPPDLIVQFMNDLMIDRTVDNNPIKILIPIPDNFVQKQCDLMVLSKEKKETEEKPSESICPENVDFLNISHAYSILINSFNDLESDRIEMFIQSQPTIEKPKPKQKIEKPKPKPKIEKPKPKPKIEQPKPKPKIEQPKPKPKIEKPKPKQKIEKPKPKPKIEKPKPKIKIDDEAKPIYKIENNDAWDISGSERTWSGPIQPVRTNKFEFETGEEKNWNNLMQETVEKLDFEKSKKGPYSNLDKNQFDIFYKESGKIFKIIDLGDNEVITLKAEKRKLAPSPENVQSLSVEGPGFKPRVWSPVPTLAISFNLEKSDIKNKFNIVSDNMTMPSERKRRPDWNLVNKASNEELINIFGKEKILVEQKVRPLSVFGEPKKPNRWNEIVRTQKGAKLVFEAKKIKSKKSKWYLSVCKEINMFYEREADEVIINDDYNDIKGTQMRPIIVTVLKVNEDEETSSVTSYDVFQNIIVKKSNIDINYNSGNKFGIGVNALKNRIDFSKKKFGHFGKRELFGKLKMAENEQKNKYDKIVSNLAFQTNNIVRDIFAKKDEN